MNTRGLVVFVVACCSVPAQVRVGQGTLTLPVYDEGPADENPSYLYFYPEEVENYPYTLRPTLTREKSRKTFRTLEIENEFLVCTILPDLGGRIYSCVDKISRRDLFYANPVIKKFRAALRGAWAAAGTEFNFPIGHSWMTVSPVDFATRQNADASGSITVAATDRVYGMRWQVDIILRPGSGELEEHVTLRNPTPVRHRYYWWNNASVEAYEDTWFYLPCQVTADHGQANIDTWPVNSAGIDMSLLANHRGGGVARFAYGCQEAFMGVYSRQNDTGTAHFADPARLPGKKIGSWGSGKARADAAKDLTDDGSQYVELQAGLFQDQETFGFLEPNQTVQFTEYWMPLRGLGGLSRANERAALHMQRSGGQLMLNLNVYSAIPNAAIRVLDDAGAVIFEQKLDLNPTGTVKRSVSNITPDAKYTFELRDSAGALILAHTEDRYAGMPAAAAKTARTPQEPDAPQSEQDYLNRGVDDEKRRNVYVALEKFEMGAAKFPDSGALHQAAGRAALELNRFQEAVDQLSHATSNAESHYYLGVAYADVGDDAQARSEFLQARDDATFGPASRVQLAGVLAREGDSMKAVEEIAGASPIEVPLLRRAGKNKQAEERLSYWLAADPAANMLRYERVKLGATDDDLWQHLAADPDAVLNVAAAYMQMGMFSDALDLVSRQYPAVDPLQREPGSVLPQDHPLVSYYRGFCRVKSGGSGKDDFMKASKQSTLYVFPSRPETFEVLQTAIAANPSDATAHFLLGSLYVAAGLPDPAALQMQSAYELHGTNPTLHATLGTLLLERRNDYEAALKVLQDGLSIDPQNTVLQDAMEQAVATKQAALAEATPKSNLFVDHTPPLASKPEQMAQLALNMLETGRIKDAAEIFNEENFPQDKQSAAVREAFIEVRLRAILNKAAHNECDQALVLAETIGDEQAKLPFTMYSFGPILKQARIQYMLGVAADTCGNGKQARKNWSRAAKVQEHAAPAESAWANIAAAKLDSSGATAHYEAALREIEANGAKPAESAYAKGLLLKTLSRSKDAEQVLNEAIAKAGADIMLGYLCRMALQEN